MPKEQTIWNMFKEYINSRPINSIIKRRDLLLSIYGKKRHYPSGLDTYRLMLSSCGILETYKLGYYTIKKHIKEDLSLKEIKKITSGSTWKSWFIDISREDNT